MHKIRNDGSVQDKGIKIAMTRGKESSNLRKSAILFGKKKLIFKSMTGLSKWRSFGIILEILNF